MLATPFDLPLPGRLMATGGLGRLVVVDSAAWVGISVLIGTAAGFVPDRWLDHDTVLTAIRPAERNGRIYRHWFRINRWKDRLPEVHGLGRGAGVSKARLIGRAEAPALLRETRRAEYVHVAVAASGPLFLLWNPPWLAAIMALAGVAFNAPFVMIQRFNRARLVGLRAVRAPATGSRGLAP